MEAGWRRESGVGAELTASAAPVANLLTAKRQLPVIDDASAGGPAPKRHVTAGTTGAETAAVTAGAVTAAEKAVVVQEITHMESGRRAARSGRGGRAARSGRGKNGAGTELTASAALTANLQELEREQYMSEDAGEDAGGGAGVIKKELDIGPVTLQPFDIAYAKMPLPKLEPKQEVDSGRLTTRRRLPVVDDASAGGLAPERHVTAGTAGAGTEAEKSAVTQEVRAGLKLENESSSDSLRAPAIPPDPSRVVHLNSNLHQDSICEWHDESSDYSEDENGYFGIHRPGSSNDDDEPVDTQRRGQLWTSREVEPDVQTLGHAVQRLVQSATAVEDAATSALLLPAQESFEWSRDFTTFQGRKGEYTGHSGPTISAVDPVEIFLHIWDTDIVSKIAEETNKYAAQQIASANFSVHSRVHGWTPTSTEEIYSLLSIFVFQSIVPLTSEKDYYGSKFIYGNINCSPALKYGRLILLKKFLHFADNTQADLISSQDDDAAAVKQHSAATIKLAKLQPIIDHCNTKFQSLYVLEQNIAIDESLTLWKGRLSWVQFIRTKRARYGIKSYELCESSSGYLWKFFIYTGKVNHTPSVVREQIGASEGDGATTLVVLKLVQGLYDKGHVLFMDNFYNAPALARVLKARGMDCVGTLRLNRKHVPASISGIDPTSMPRGQLLALHSGDVTVLAWKDKQKIGMISTFHGPQYSVSSQAGHPINKPDIVLDYNKHMGGVDLKDQCLSSFPVERLRNKWYLKMFRRLLNASVLNAYIIHCKNIARLPEGSRPKLLTHRLFRKEIVIGLYRRSTESAPAQALVPRLAPGFRPIVQNGHYIMLTPRKESAARANQQRCRVCVERGVRKATAYRCETCEVPLCIGQCFKDYHTLHSLV